MTSVTSDLIAVQLIYLLRMVLACLCGGAIGFERKRRLKEAGIRTHLIVALSACLIMIISKYGFADLGVEGSFFPGTRGADPARVAAQVVSGMGFLGAGIIFVRGRVISGLTTAAGMWLTTGVGLAFGCGMYAVGVAATVLILIVQGLLHRPLHRLEGVGAEDVVVTLENTEAAMGLFLEQLRKRSIQIMESSMQINKDGTVTLDMSVKAPNGLPMNVQWEMTRENPYLKAIKF